MSIPCDFCQNCCIQYDNFVREWDAECRLGEEPPMFNKPCKSFIPILASDGLFEHLANEEMEREYLEWRDNRDSD